jgi:hypothetical protein
LDCWCEGQCTEVGHRHQHDWQIEINCERDFAQFRARHLEKLARPGQEATPGRLAGILRKMATCAEGERNDLLHWCACRLVEGGYPPEAYEGLEVAATHAGLPMPEIAKTINSARRGAGR